MHVPARERRPRKVSPGSGGRRAGAGRPVGSILHTAAQDTATPSIRVLSAESTLEQIRRGMEWDVREMFDAHGAIKPITELSIEAASMVAGFEVLKRNLTAGDGKVDEVIKIKLVDRARYVEMAAKHHKLLTDVIETRDARAFASKIQAARARATKGDA